MPSEQVIKKSALVPTVLIAGGAGFIGSHLAEALLLQGARVIVLDNFTTGKDVYVQPLLENPKFALFNVDINKQLPPTIQSVDYIVHLAGFENYIYSRDEVNLESLLTNATGTKNLLDLANRSPAKFLLVSSIDVYQGLISPINIEHYFGQTAEEEKRYSHTEAKRFAEALVWEYYKKHNTDVRITRFPEVYGPRMNFSSSGNLGRLLRELTEYHRLTVYGDGIEKEYYLYVSDAINGVIKALFSDKSEGKIYTLTEAEPYTVLETTYLVKSVANADIQVDFKSQVQKVSARPVSPDRSNLKELGWEPKIAFKDGITRTLKWAGYEVNTHAFKPAKLIEKKAEEKKRGGVETIAPLFAPIVAKPSQDKRDAITSVAAKDFDFRKAPILIGSFILALTLIFTGVPAVQTLTHAKAAADDLKKIPTLIAQLNTQEAQGAAESAFQESIKARKAFGKMRWVFVLAKKQEAYNSINGLFGSSIHFSKTLYKLSKISEPYVSLWEVIRPNSASTLNAKEISDTRTEVDGAFKQLQFAQAEFKNVNIDSLPLSTRKTALEFEAALAQTSKVLESASAFSYDLPKILGTDSPKRYLMLLQNSNEIRPTGGFIGSYAFLEFEDGKIRGLTIDDVYNPDGQIDLRKILVAPPQPIKAFLGEEALHIRNANWDPDFPESAEKIKDLFFRVDGKDIDGVIAIDLQMAQSLLKVTGPVYLTAYNEEITADNLYERAQLHSEFNYTDGSDQKKSFLTLLGGKTLEKIFALPDESLPALFKQFHSSLEQKHTLVYLPKTSFSAFLKANGWDGSVADVDGDYLYVVNANLGGTKANYYVEQSAVYEVSSKTRDGLLRAGLTLNYEHTGKDNSWPGGAYTNYVRVITQTGTKLTGAKLEINGSETDIFKDVVISKESGHPSYEASFKLQPQQKARVVLEYDLPANLALTRSNEGYKLFWQKQPGTLNDEYGVTLNPPFGMKVLNTFPDAEFSKDSVTFKGVQNTDVRVDVKLK